MIDYATLSSLLLGILLIFGLVILFFGGNWLARGASSLALNLDVNPIIVGLTVVSIATSAPELLTAMLAAAHGSPGLAIGNIIGSNLANSGLILGVAAIICPIDIQMRLIRQEVPLLLSFTILFIIMSMGGIMIAGRIGHLEGIVLLMLGFAYLIFITVQGRRAPAVEQRVVEADLEQAISSLWLCIGLIVLAAISLCVGADVLVGSAVEVARRLQLSDVIVGMTVVAIGTSLPELAAAIAAARRKQSDLIAGNIIGSNIFNLLFIGGGVATFYPLSVEQKIIYVEFPAIMLITGLLWYAFYTQCKVTRKEGTCFLILYFLVIGLSYWSQR